MSSRKEDGEIEELINKLGSKRKVEIDAAKARLSIIGTRAVEHLIEALDRENTELKLNAIPILALIRDQRAKNPLIAMLLERNPKIRESATRALANFPARETIHSLERLLGNEKDMAVRVAAVYALVEIFKGGHDGSIGSILEVLFNSDEKHEVRIAALSIIPFLKTGEKKAILKKLKDDPDQRMKQRLMEMEKAPEPKNHTEGRIKKAIQLLSSTSYEELNESINFLISSGESVIEPLIGEMIRRGNDAEFCSRVSIVLKGLEPSCLRLIVLYLDLVIEPLPLKILVDLVGSIEDKSLLYKLKGLIDRINSDPGLLENQGENDPYRKIKARAHLQLAKAGSRVAIDDLKETLMTGKGSIDMDLLSALEFIGKKEELSYLFRAYPREDEWTKEKIKNVFLKIMRREKIRRNNKLFKIMARENPAILKELLP
ncbi:MAG: HEAT repeat domain-containing protein [Acidobacteriota bacterium]